MKAHHILTSLVLGGILAVQTVVAGSVVNPVPIAPGDICYRCNRVILDRWVAGEVIGTPSTSQKFRTIRCMLTYLNSALPRTNHVFVTDDQTGTLIEANGATFVPVVIDDHTGIPQYGIGRRDYVAFRSTDVAEKFAARTHEQTMSWAAVVFEVQLLINTSETRNTD